MTASIVSVPARAARADLSRGPLPGLRALFRKDLGEWTHGARAIGHPRRHHRCS